MIVLLIMNLLFLLYISVDLYVYWFSGQHIKVSGCQPGIIGMRAECDVWRCGTVYHCILWTVTITLYQRSLNRRTTHYCVQPGSRLLSHICQFADSYSYMWIGVTSCGSKPYSALMMVDLQMSFVSCVVTYLYIVYHSHKLTVSLNLLYIFSAR